MTAATLRTKTKERGRLQSAILAKQASIAWWKIHYVGNIFFRQFYLYGNNNHLCTRYVHLTHSVSQPYFYWNFAFILAFWKGYYVGVMAHLITSFFCFILDKKSFPRAVTLTSIKKVQSSWRGKPQETINETTEIFPG